MKFEITTCYMGKASTMDAALVADVVAKHVDQEEGVARYNGGAHFALKSTEVFNGTRRAWTNVDFTVELKTYAAAQALVKELIEVTNYGWNSPSQDYDDIQEELAGAKSWGMFTAKGAREVQNAVDLLDQSLRNGTLSPLKLQDAVEAHQSAISKAGFGEVYDTAVREEIWGALDAVLDELGIRLELR